MPMVVHEEGAPVGHEGRILIPSALVILVFLAAPFSRLLLGCRSGADDDGDRRRFRRWGQGLVEIYLLHGLGLVRERQAVQHSLGVGDPSIAGSRGGGV
jgi:hypothetical protein